VQRDDLGLSAAYTFQRRPLGGDSRAVVTVGITFPLVKFANTRIHVGVADQRAVCSRARSDPSRMTPTPMQLMTRPPAHDRRRESVRRTFVPAQLPGCCASGPRRPLLREVVASRGVRGVRAVRSRAPAFRRPGRRLHAIAQAELSAGGRALLHGRLADRQSLHLRVGQPPASWNEHLPSRREHPQVPRRRGPTVGQRLGEPVEQR